MPDRPAGPGQAIRPATPHLLAAPAPAETVARLSDEEVEALLLALLRRDLDD